MLRIACFPLCFVLLAPGCSLPQSSAPYYEHNRAKYLVAAARQPDPQPSRPTLSVPAASAPRPPIAPGRPAALAPEEQPGDRQLDRAQAALDAAARHFKADLAKMEKPWLVLMVNRPLDLQTGLVPRTKTVKTVKRNGKVVETVEEEVFDRPTPSAAPLLHPDQQFYAPPIEAWLDTAFRRAGCDLRDARLVWVEARGRRSAPTIGDLSRHADLLVNVTIATGAGADAGAPHAQMLGVAGTVVELASGRILARATFCLAADSRETGHRQVAGERSPAARTRNLDGPTPLKLKTLIMARELLEQTRASWNQGIDYRFSVGNLASQTQAEAIRKFLVEKCRATDVKLTSELRPPRGGKAILHFKSPVKPSDLVDALQRLDAFKSFRLELTARRYSTLCATCIYR